MAWLKKFYNNSRFLNHIRYMITPFVIKNKKQGLLFDGSSFFRLNLNCRGDAYYGYVNIEDTRTKRRVFVSSMHHLPFSDKNVKFIIADFETLKDKPGLKNIFKEWARVMVPNGLLTLDNFNVLDERSMSILREEGFEFIFGDQKALLPIAHFLYSPDMQVAVSDTKPFWDKLKSQDRVKIEDVLERMSPIQGFRFLKELYNNMEDSNVIELFLKNEVLYECGVALSFFDKANIAQVLNGIGFYMENIESITGIIKIELKKNVQYSPYAIKKLYKERVCAIEQYLMFRYPRLGFDEDGLPLAFEKLGYDCFSVEGMRNVDHKVIQDAIIHYKPKYIITRLKEVLPILFDIKKVLENIGTKTIFWFTDPALPKDVDLGGVVDIMFLSNAGLIEEYKKTFNLERVYFMAQSYMPYAIHHMSVAKKYDVAFTGALSGVSLHSTRKALLDKLKSKYTVGIKNNARNNVAEFYAEAKFVFGVSDFPHLYYTSNRFFVAMGCGSVYLTKKFPGIDRFVRNKEHVLWFENELEMLELIEGYIKNDAERIKIGENAQRLAESKHTTVHRVKNMIDIVEGKTEEFYGFLG